MLCAASVYLWGCREVQIWQAMSIPRRPHSASWIDLTSAKNNLRFSSFSCKSQNQVSMHGQNPEGTVSVRLTRIIKFLTPTPASIAVNMTWNIFVPLEFS